MIDFLNSLLQGERVITDIRYMNNEREPEQKEMRKVIYDIYCETDTGEHIIVEMQNRWQEHFRDRALYYLSKSIVQQGTTGEKWDYNLTAVYGVFFINFLLDKEPTEYFCKDVALIDKYTGKVFNNKLRQIYIELPKFVKAEQDCDNFFEYWIFNLVNMNNMEQISFKDKNAIFARLEKIASQANLTKEERAKYEEEWKIYNDYFNTIESAEKKVRMEMEKDLELARATAYNEGQEKGRAEGEIKAKLETAKNMKAMGLAQETIIQITGLSAEEIEKL